MNATKFFVTAVTAMSVIGAISFAYAQTTNPEVPAVNSNTQSQTTPAKNAAPMDSTLPNNRGTSDKMNSSANDTMAGTASTPARDTAPDASLATPSDGSAMSTERAARSDRN
jgi:hypothetical protein